MVAMRTGAAGDAAFRPGTLVTHAEGSYSLVYSNFPHVAAMDARGVAGGGYTWHALVLHLIQNDAPRYLDALSFDPNASTFCAVSSNLDALRAVAHALARLEEPALLSRLVEVVDFSAYE